MADLEVIDYLSADSDRQFVASLHAIGFAALKNHPLDMVLVNRIYAQWRDFFSSDRKFQFELNRATQDGYYSTQNAESAKGHGKQDFKEYYHFYTWGQCPPELRQDLQQYYDAAHRFAATLLGWVETYAPASVSANFSEALSAMIKDSQVTLLRVLHYPPTGHLETTTWAAAHEDINLLTILPAADEPGLQVQHKDGSWLNVSSDRNQVVVNIGDMLQEASAGYFPSTTHRVVISTDIDAKGSESVGRMSLPLFLHPRPEVRLSDRYTAGSYLNERLKELGVSEAP